MAINKFSNLWKEEQRVISKISDIVPDNGTIVEIGTFQGGTSQILYESTHKRGIKIYTVDIKPSALSYKNLENTNVEIIAKSSRDASVIWGDLVNRPIDLLFLDGSHKFKDVFDDFNSWVNWLKPNGTIIFHDYDPVERGGVVHLGVQICVDTVISNGFLNGPEHEYKLLYGTVVSPGELKLSANNCLETFIAIGNKIVNLRSADYSGWELVADAKFTVLLERCLDLRKCLRCTMPMDTVIPNGKYLVSAHPLGIPLGLFKKLGVPQNSITVIDSLMACYLVAPILATNFEYLYEASANPAEFWRLFETIEMIDDVCGESVFTNMTNLDIVGTNITQLANLITREQIRLNIIARIIQTFVDWTP